MSKIVQESNALYGVLNILHVHTLKYSWTAEESSLGSKGLPNVLLLESIKASFQNLPRHLLYMNSGSIFGHELQEGRHEQIHSNRILVKKNLIQFCMLRIFMRSMLVPYSESAIFLFI